MPYINQHVRVAFNGDIATTEVWSTGFSIFARPDGSVGDATTLAGLEYYAQVADTIFRARWATTLGGLFGAVVGYSECTAALIDVDGRTIFKHREAGTRITGSGVIAHPPQTSMVASLRTNVPGPRGRGRMYFPATGAAMASDGVHILPADVNALGLNVDLVLEGINATDVPVGWIGPGDVRVMSSVGEGLASKVIELRVGDVFDTQRRRAQQIPETYGVWPVAP